MKKNLIFLTILITVLLSSCSTNTNNRDDETLNQNGHVFINNKEISEIVFSSTISDDLPLELIGVWVTDNGTWNLYEDGTYLVQAYMQDVGSWFTSGTWTVSDNKLIVSINSFNKKDNTYETKEYVYDYELRGNQLHILNEDELVDILFTKYVQLTQ